MKHYHFYSQDSKKFIAMTGYELNEFNALLPTFSETYENHAQSFTFDGTPRLRKFVDYKNSPLRSMEDKLLFILIYLKQGTTQEMHSSLFGMKQTKANKWIHWLHPILKQTLKKLGELPARQLDEMDFQEVPSSFFHDGTERSINRPKDSTEQQAHYSGKKTAYGEK